MVAWIVSVEWVGECALDRDKAHYVLCLDREAKNLQAPDLGNFCRVPYSTVSRLLIDIAE